MIKLKVIKSNMENYDNIIIKNTSNNSIETQEHTFKRFTWNILYCKYNKIDNIGCERNC